MADTTKESIPSEGSPEQSSEDNQTPEAKAATEVLGLIILCVLVWVLFYLRGYVFWALWSVFSHVFLVGSTLYVASHFPGLSKILGVGPQRAPTLSGKKHTKMWREYVLNTGMFTRWSGGLLLYSFADYTFGIGIAWGGNAHAFPLLLL